MHVTSRLTAAPATEPPATPEAEQSLPPAEAPENAEAPKSRFLIAPRRLSNLLLYGTLAFFALLLAWATFTQIDRTVYATGRVVPTAQLQRVSNLEGGIISRILVSAGEVVREGQALIQIDPTLAESEFSTSASSLSSLDAKVERLRAETSGQSPNFPTPANPAARIQIGIEEALYASRQADLQSITQAGEARITQARRAVAEAQANFASTIARRDSARQQLDIMRPLVEKGIEPRMTLVQAEQQASVAESGVAAAQAAIARSQASVAEAAAALAQARQGWRAQAASELAAAQAEAAGRREAQPALANRLERTLVRAPLAGEINRVLVNTIGGTIRPGEPIVEIVPSSSGLTIEAAVRPQDIAFIHIGQRALIKITAYDYGTYGGLEGKVIGISPDSIVNEETGETQYLIKVRANDDALTSPAGQRLPVSAGMIADVNLMGDKRSVLSYLLNPFTKLTERAFRE